MIAGGAPLAAERIWITGAAADPSETLRVCGSVISLQQGKSSNSDIYRIITRSPKSRFRKIKADQGSEMDTNLLRRGS